MWGNYLVVIKCWNNVKFKLFFKKKKLKLGFCIKKVFYVFLLVYISNRVKGRFGVKLICNIFWERNELNDWVCFVNN